MTSWVRRCALTAAAAAGALALSVPAGASGHAHAGMTGTSPMSGMDAKMQAASRAAAKAKPKAATTVVIHNFAFSPGSIKVKPGQKVKVENMDSVAHTLTSTTGKFNTGDIAPGKTVTFTAPKTAGRYPYRCQIHQYMTGVLTVS